MGQYIRSDTDIKNAQLLKNIMIDHLEEKGLFKEDVDVKELKKTTAIFIEDPDIIYALWCKAKKKDPSLQYFIATVDGPEDNEEDDE